MVGKEQNGAGGITDEKVLKDCTSDEAGLSKHKGVELSGTWGVSVLGLSLLVICVKDSMKLLSKALLEVLD